MKITQRVDIVRNVMCERHAAISYVVLQAHVYKPEIPFTLEQLYRLVIVRRNIGEQSIPEELYVPLIPIASSGGLPSPNPIGRITKGTFGSVPLHDCRFEDYFRDFSMGIGKDIEEDLQNAHTRGYIHLRGRGSIKLNTPMATTQRTKNLFPLEFLLRNDLPDGISEERANQILAGMRKFIKSKGTEY